MKTYEKLFLVLLLLTGLALSSKSFATEITNCRPTPGGRTVCTTFGEHGGGHTDYWNNTPGGGSYKSSSFNFGRDEDSNEDQ